jgi:catechol 2,3-dioxygenase-like lactoylglutathione lyase family enzyme
MLLKHVAYVALFVSDQDRALEFYTRVLGFEKRAENPTPAGPRFLTVGLPGQGVELVLWPGTPGQAQAFEGRRPGTYTFETSDCRLAFETLRARGVTFEPSAVLEHPWGFTATLRDPDGNVLTLRQGRVAA